MKWQRMMYVLLAIASLVIVIVKPVANLVADSDPAAEAIARGATIHNAESVNEGYMLGNLVMLFLFGSLALVFLWRAIRPLRPKDVQADSQECGSDTNVVS